MLATSAVPTIHALYLLIQVRKRRRDGGSRITVDFDGPAIPQSPRQPAGRPQYPEPSRRCRLCTGEYRGRAAYAHLQVKRGMDKDQKLGFDPTFDPYGS